MQFAPVVVLSAGGFALAWRSRGIVLLEGGKLFEEAYCPLR
jgi:hypothetical protein